jgi:hypothetical protein
MSKIQQWLRQLWESYRSAVLRPNPTKFELEASRANWATVWFGLLVVAIACAIEYAALDWQYGWYFRDIEAMFSAFQIDPAPIVAFRDLLFWGGPLRGFISPFITFFLGALFLMWVARLFGGRGRTGSFKEDFLVHCYLLSLVYTPLRTVMGLLGIIPLVGGLVGLLAYCYHIYCAGVTLQVSHGLNQGRAQWAVWVPQVVWYLVTTTLVTLVLIFLVFTSMVTAFDRLVLPR